MSFYLECFDKKTKLIILQYKLKNVTIKPLQDLMNVSEKRRKEDPRYILSWRNNKVSKRQIYFFENLLQGRNIDLNKYTVHLSNLDDDSETLKVCGETNEDITFHEPPDWLDEQENKRINCQIKEEINKEEIFQKKISFIKKHLIFILNEIKNYKEQQQKEISKGRITNEQKK